jgi:hemolysin III
MPNDFLNQSYRDGGPYYTETLTGLDRTLVEPWNAVSALAFLALVLFYALRLRGRYGQYLFLCGCLPILAVGGIGGTLYHGLRRYPFFLVMDYMPIFVLVMASSLYLWRRVIPRWWYLPILVMAYLLLATVLFRQVPRQIAITLNYALLGLFTLLPTVLVLVSTRWRHSGWIGLALGAFGVALVFRYADTLEPPLLPMGTHWLWHLFGAFAAGGLAEYLYRLRREHWSVSPT